MSSANQILLEEVNQAHLWFHAKKFRPIHARRVNHEQTIETLEGIERVLAGTYLCRGEAGEVWPQSEERLMDRYTPTGRVDANGWREYKPHPSDRGVMSAQIPHAFEVQGVWGRLSGKPGDFLVKNAEDRDVAYPDDLWIVDQVLFRATYEAVENSTESGGR